MSPILLVLWLLTGIIFIYWVWFYLSFKHIIELNNERAINNPDITIIICYKNAGEQIHKTIQAILGQDYGNFEVIVIDDFSTDNGPNSLKLIDDRRLRLLKARINKPGKKAALTEAIQVAKNEILLFTDADCVPASAEWVSSMVKKMVEKEGVDIVLGYGPMNRRKDWLNRFSRFETVFTAMQYFSYAISGMTYMGVGRNLMYRKSLFERVHGFERHQHLASGDDDLLISDGSKEDNVTICLNDTSFMYSNTKTTLFEFLNQKSRHISTSSRYSTLHKLLLGVFALSQIGFYITILLSISFGWVSWQALLIVTLLKWSFQMILQNHIFKKLEGSDLNRWFPLLDILLVVYYLVLPVYGILRKKEW